MKHEIGITQPGYLVEDWPGKYEHFSWLEYVVNVPNPVFLVTTRKPNGAPNANLHAWGLLTGDRAPGVLHRALLARPRLERAS